MNTRVKVPDGDNSTTVNVDSIEIMDKWHGRIFMSSPSFSVFVNYLTPKHLRELAEICNQTADFVESENSEPRSGV